MELGMIGLGRMGGAMSQRLMQAGHQVAGYARSTDTMKQLEEKGLIAASSVEDLVSKLKPQRIIWLMIPSGKPVDETIGILMPLLEADDVIIDGGNSDYKDTLRRAEMLKTHKTLTMLRKISRERSSSCRSIEPESPPACRSPATLCPAMPVPSDCQPLRAGVQGALESVSSGVSTSGPVCGRALS